MQCKDVKQWMNDNKGELSAAVAEHLSQCPSCARAARANRRLNDLFKASMDSETVPSFEAIRSRTEALATESTPQEKIMAFIKNQFQTRPGVLAGATLAIAAFLFITLVPLSYTHTAGYTISVLDGGSDEDSTLQKVEKAIEDADADHVTMVISSEGDTKHYTIAALNSREVADRIVVALEDNVNERVKVSVEPVVRIKSDPIYAQVISKVKADSGVRPRIRIQLPDVLFDGDEIVDAVQDLEVSDTEIENRISKKFTDAGVPADEVSVSSETDADKGTRFVRIILPSDDTESGEMQLEMSFGFRQSDSEYKNLALTLKSGKLVKVHMDEEVDGDVIIMKVTTDDSD